MKSGATSLRLLAAPPADILVPMSLALIAAAAMLMGRAAKSCPSREIADLRAELQMADNALEQQDYRQANDLAKAAIAEIGDRSFQPGVIDDTGQHLVLAETQNDARRTADIRVRWAHFRLTAMAQNLGC